MIQCSLGKISYHYTTVDLEKNTCQEGLLVANWAQIHNQTPAVVADTGLSLRLQFREKPQAERPASCRLGQSLSESA